MAIRVEFEKTSVWNTGFVGEVFVYNETDETLPNYEVGFDLDAGITVVWNGVFEKTPEGRYLVVDDDDKNDIAPGEMVRFKFKAYGDDPAAAVPSGFTVNGTAVDLDPSVSPGLPVDPPPAEPVEPPETGPDGSIEVAAGTTVAEIQKLIGSAPAGSTIKLAPGTFVFDRPLEIERDDIAIIGSGEQQTKILMDFDEAPDHGIHVAGGATSSLGRLGADAGFDDRTIQVDGAGSIKAGDVLLLSQPNDDAWLDSIGDDSWRKDKPLRESLVKVESVSGDQVRLENGVHFDFEKGATTVSKIDLFENVELGGFTVEFPFGEADPAKLSNTMSDYNRFIAVRVDGTIGADVHDITVDQGPSMAFQFERALYLDADGLSAHGAHNKGSGGNGYAYQLRYTFDSELSNLEDSGMRHSLVFASWTSSVGNQAHVLQTDRDINFHGGRDHHNHVHVERSVRIPENDVMSNVTWFDEDGTRWGAPTDMTHNRATYDFVLGSKRDDIVEAADGGAYIDGRGANDVLIGGRGNDVLIGGAGRDHLIGGAGDDVAVYGSKAGEYKVTRDGDGIQVKGPDGTDRLEGIEFLRFGDDQVVDVRGLTGSQSGDQLPSAGGDAPRGPGPSASTGDPVVPSGGDEPTSSETAGSGGRGDAAPDEDVVTRPDEDVVTRPDEPREDDAKPSPTNGSDQVARLIGDGGDDRLVGGAGSEKLVGRAGDDVLDGGAGDDKLIGNDGADELHGGAGDDKLIGNSGADVLHGGAGADRLIGGPGADVFRFHEVGDSRPGAADEISDFAPGDDLIDLSSLTTGGGALSYVGRQAFSGTAGEVRFDDHRLEVDQDGDGDAELEVEIKSANTLNSDDFLL